MAHFDQATDMLYKAQKTVSGLDNSNATEDPKNRKPYMSMWLRCRDELKFAKKENLATRRAALKQLTEKDLEKMETALVRIGLGFIPTQP